MKASIKWLWLYLLVPITGTGTEADPYRPDIPPTIIEWAAHLPSDANGSMKYATTIISVPDGTEVPKDAEVLTVQEATVLMNARDPNAKMKDLQHEAKEKP